MKAYNHLYWCLVAVILQKEVWSCGGSKNIEIQQQLEASVCRAGTFVSEWDSCDWLLWFGGGGEGDLRFSDRRLRVLTATFWDIAFVNRRLRRIIHVSVSQKMAKFDLIFTFDTPRLTQPTMKPCQRDASHGLRKHCCRPSMLMYRTPVTHTERIHF
jgi:hypothetical protein